jgi:hypothetical protein
LIRSPAEDDARPAVEVGPVEGRPLQPHPAELGFVESCAPKHCRVLLVRRDIFGPDRQEQERLHARDSRAASTRDLGVPLDVPPLEPWPYRAPWPEWKCPQGRGSIDVRWSAIRRRYRRGMMPPQQKTRKPPQDPYAQRGKQLTSAVQRLRGWVGSDPSRNVELADALVELNRHRLLGHEYPAAARDAQDAVRRSAELLTAKGPMGPYSSIEDAVRYVTAVVHLAAAQAGLGLPESAGRTIASVEQVERQLEQLRLQERLDPVTAIWALCCTARGALASGEIAVANANADAALTRLDEAELRADPDCFFLPIDVDRLASDSRWAAGRPEESLTLLHRAKEQYDRVVDGRLGEPTRLSPALVERLAEPLFGLYRDLADRLFAGGETDLALVTRRELLALLRTLQDRLGNTAKLQLAATLIDLADDLVRSERLEEAERIAGEAEAKLPGSPSAGSLDLLLATVRGRILTRTGRADEAVLVLRAVTSAETPDTSAAARAVALLGLSEALRNTDEPESAAAVDQQAHQLAADLLGADLDRFDLRTALSDKARGVVGGMQVARTDSSTTPSWLDAERALASRQERDRLEQAKLETARREAEQAAAEQLAAQRAADQRARAELAEQQEAERRAAAEEAERLERKRRRAERIEQHRLEVERREAERQAAEQQAGAPAEPAAPAGPDELAVALTEWRESKARGDRRLSRSANERVVDLLRPRARTDMATYGLQLLDALEELSRSRLRSGDVWGSRAPAREAKDLAKILRR